MKILVFLQGTLIMHRTGQGCPRLERVRQVEVADPSVRDYESYVPVGHAVEKLKGWVSQGATVAYLSSHQNAEDVEADRKVLITHSFPEGRIFFREAQQNYGSVAQHIAPDILIEDDCQSIGGESEMTYPNLDEPFKRRIKSIVVKEFAGIDDLPEKIEDLLAFHQQA